MRHKKLNKRLGRNKSQREQLMRSLARAIFIAYRIQTTVEKAKEARKVVEKIVTLAKAGQLKDIRAMEKILQDRALVSKIVKVVAPLASKRKGGYTRIIRTGFRRGDGASLAILELTDMPVIVKETKKGKKLKAAAPTAPVEEAKAKKPVKDSIPKAGKPKKEATDSAEVVKEEKVALVAKKEDKSSEKVKEPKKEDKPKLSKEEQDGLLGKFKGFFKKDK